LLTHRRARSLLGCVAGGGDGREKVGRLRAGSRHRSASISSTSGTTGKPRAWCVEQCGHLGRSEWADVQSLCAQPGEVWWCGVDIRLGGRSLLHRLWPAFSCDDPIMYEGKPIARRTPSRSASSSPSTTRWRSSPRRPLSRHQEGRSEAIHPKYICRNSATLFLAGSAPTADCGMGGNH